MGQFPQDGENGQNLAFIYCSFSSAVTKRFDFFQLFSTVFSKCFSFGLSSSTTLARAVWSLGNNGTTNHHRHHCNVIKLLLTFLLDHAGTDKFHSKASSAPSQVFDKSVFAKDCQIFGEEQACVEDQPFGWTSSPRWMAVCTRKWLLILQHPF